MKNRRLRQFTASIGVSNSASSRNVVACAEFPAAIAEQQQEAIGYPGREVNVVKTRDHTGATVGGVSEDAQGVDLVLGVEVVRRLIEQVDVGRLG
jgi:hypothetical protein